MAIHKIKDWLKVKDDNRQFYFMSDLEQVAIRIKDNRLYAVGHKFTSNIYIDHFDTDNIHVYVSVYEAPIIKVEINSLPDSWSYGIKT